MLERIRQYLLRQLDKLNLKNLIIWYSTRNKLRHLFSKFEVLFKPSSLTYLLPVSINLNIIV